MDKQTSGCCGRLLDGCCLIIAALGVSIIGSCSLCGDEVKQTPVCVIRHQKEYPFDMCREREE